MGDQFDDNQLEARYMSAAQYVAKAMSFQNRNVPHEDEYLESALGLAGEAGEIADIIKKHKFQGHELDTEKIINELGDVLWYAALMCDTIGVTMEYVFYENIAKLSKRYHAGVFRAEDSVNRVAEEEIVHGVFDSVPDNIFRLPVQLSENVESSEAPTSVMDQLTGPIGNEDYD